MGLQAEFIDTPWDDIFINLNADKYDCIISSVTITAQRLEEFNFSMPYIQNTLAIVMPKNSRHSVKSPNDLSGLRVAYQRGTTSDDYMRQMEREGIRFTAFEYNNVVFCFDEMRLGRIDAILTDLLVAYEYITRHSDVFEIVWQGYEEEFGICIKKGNDRLTEAINKALEELFNDGTMLRISRETFNGMDLVSALHE
jgi:polar amino acid transport system substrate-binding protein